MMLERFIEQNTGKLVNFDGVPDNAGQSPQLVAAWCRFIGLPYQWANAIDWWDGSDETFAEHWEAIEFDPTSDTRPRAGDIMVFSSRLPGSERMGHLSLFVEAGNRPDAWIGFDANWGGKSAHLQSHNWAYVLGWFTPVPRGVLEAEIPTAIARPTTVKPYEIDEVESFKVAIKADLTPLYNLSDVSWDSFQTNTMGYHNAGTEIVVRAIARHRLGGLYFMPHPDRAEGYDVVQCTGYDSSILPDDVDDDVDLTFSERVILGSDPDIRATPHSHPIAAPVMAPNSSDTLQTIKKIPKYRSAGDALIGINTVGELSNDKYFVFKRLPSGVINVTKELGVSGYWINPEDLKERDWHNLRKLETPLYYRAKHDSEILDLDGRLRPLRIINQQPILIAGYFTGPDGQEYAAPELTISENQWYGCPISQLEVINYVPEVIGQIDEAPAYSYVSPGQDLYDKIRLTLQNSQILKLIKEKYKG